MAEEDWTITGWPKKTACPRCGRTAVVLDSTVINARYECRGDPDPASNSAYAPDACFLVFKTGDRG